MKLNCYGVQRPIVFLAALIPVAFIPNFGDSFFTIKDLLSRTAGAVCAIQLALRSKSQRISGLISIPAPVLLWALIAIFQILTISWGGNPGRSIEAICDSISLCVITLWASQVSLYPSDLRKMIISYSVVCLFATLAVFFRFRISSQSDLLAATLGTRNAVAVFIAVMLPILISFTRFRLETKSHRFFRSILWILVSTGIFICLTYRTRSAWILLVIEFLLMFGLPVFIECRKPLFFAFLIAFLAFVYLPNGLRWSSIDPYKDTVSRLLSLESSSGRNILWRGGIKLFLEKPFLGWGSGNLPVFFREALNKSEISSTGVETHWVPVIFNDTLQMAIESGLFAALLFLIAAVLYPSLLTYQLLRWKAVSFEAVCFQFPFWS